MELSKGLEPYSIEVNKILSFLQDGGKSQYEFDEQFPHGLPELRVRPTDAYLYNFTTENDLMILVAQDMVREGHLEAIKKGGVIFYRLVNARNCPNVGTQKTAPS